MRKYVLALIIAVWAVLPLAAAAQGPMGMGMGMDDDMMSGRMGMMMGRGMGCGMAGTFDMLDLSAEQRTKMNKIFDDLRKEHWAIMGKMMDERAAMRDLYEEDKLDAKKIGAAFDAMSALRKQMVMTKIEAMNKARGMLTKEQMETLKRSGRGTMGMPGCGMRGGMGGGGGAMMREMMMDK